MIRTRRDARQLNLYGGNKTLSIGWGVDTVTRYPSTNVPVAYVAQIHNEGLGNQTAKHYVEHGIDAAKQSGLFRQVGQAIVNGLNPDRDLARLGTLGVNGISAGIVGIGLIDTGLLRQSLDFKIGRVE